MKSSECTKRILISTVPSQAKGGIFALHQILFSALPDTLIPFPFASETPFSEHLISRIIRVVIDANRFIWRLNRDKALRVIHINTAPDSRALLRDALLIFVSHIFRKKVILQIHGAIEVNRYNFFVKWVAATAFPFCDRILLFSTKDVNWLQSIVPSVAMEIFPNAIRTADFKNSDKTFKVGSNIPPENMIVLFLSRMIPEKGVLDLLEAVPRVIDEFKRVNFVFAGDGPILKDMKTICHRKGLDHCVLFLGHLDYKGVINAMTNSDIFVLPTYYVEGMPTAILQALASGLPVISTPMGGIADVLKDGTNGFIINPHSPIELADKLLTLLKDDQLRKRIGNTNRALAINAFDVKVVSDKLNRLYETV